MGGSTAIQLQLQLHRQLQSPDQSQRRIASQRIACLKLVRERVREACASAPRATIRNAASTSVARCSTHSPATFAVHPYSNKALFRETTSKASRLGPQQNRLQSYCDCDSAPSSSRREYSSCVHALLDSVPSPQKHSVLDPRPLAAPLTLADPRRRSRLSGVPPSTTASVALPLPAPRQPPFATLTYIASPIMQQWQVGPVPDYVYSNSPHPSNDMHNHPYPADMARRNEARMDFPYGAQPNMAAQQQHHPAPVQPPMNVSQQPPNGPPSQQQTPTQPAAQPPSARSRKRPAQNAAPSPATAAAPPPVAPAQGQPPAPTPPAPQAAPPAQPQAAATEDANSNAAASGPPAKKSRTNTPWTPQEELRLKQMRDAGNSWAEIAKTFPTRTEGSVKKHWYKDMHYAEFAEDESQALLNAIKEYENNKWKVIGQKVGKPAKACEQYAKEHFPDLFGNPKGR
ncbi:hypothetical protein TgHK011_006903 [Trichoderma gracile]|nr:hypothetical protein TgHK011_006903 [Trichoderma gracile]